MSKTSRIILKSPHCLARRCVSWTLSLSFILIPALCAMGGARPSLAPGAAAAAAAAPQFFPATGNATGAGYPASPSEPVQFDRLLDVVSRTLLRIIGTVFLIVGLLTCCSPDAVSNFAESVRSSFDGRQRVLFDSDFTILAIQILGPVLGILLLLTSFLPGLFVLGILAAVVVVSIVIGRS